MPGGLTTLSNIKRNTFSSRCVLQGALSRHIKCQVVTHQPHPPGGATWETSLAFPSRHASSPAGFLPIPGFSEVSYFSPQETTSDASSQSICLGLSIHPPPNLPPFALPSFSFYTFSPSVSQSVNKQLNIDSMLGLRNIKKEKDNTPEGAQDLGGSPSIM